VNLYLNTEGRLNDTPKLLGRIVQPQNWFWILLVYFSVHFALRVFLSDSLQVDGAEQINDSRYFQYNYGNFQPPLFTWALHLIWKVLPVSLETFVAVRYLILFATFFLWHRIALILFKYPEWVFLASTSWLLFYDFGWKLHQGSTHTTLLMLSLAMSYHAILRVYTFRSAKEYIYLGVALGLGVSSKFSYPGFILLALLASSFTSEYRQLLINKKFFYTLIASLIVALPAWISLLNEPQSVEVGLQSQIAYGLGGLLFGDMGFLLNALEKSLAFLLPYIIFIPFFLKTGDKGAQVEDPQLQWLGKFLGFYVLMVFISALFLEAGYFKARWLHVFLWLTPFLVVRYLVNKRVGVSFKRYLIVLVAFSLLAFFARLGQLYGHVLLDKPPSRISWPILTTIKKIPDSVFALKNPLCFKDEYLQAHFLLHDRTRYFVIDHQEKDCLSIDSKLIKVNKLTKLKNAEENSVATYLSDWEYQIKWEQQ